MIIEMLRKFRGLVAFYVGNGIVQVICSAIAVVFFQRLIDSITLADGITGVAPVLTGYGIFAALDYLLNYADGYPWNRLENGMLQYLKIKAMKKISVVDYGASQGIGTGGLIQRVENGARAGANMALGFWLRLARELLPGVVVNLAFVGFYDPGAMLAVMAGYAVVFLITALLLKYLYKIKKRILKNEEWMSRTFVRALMEVVVFRVNRRFKEEIDRYSKVSDETVSARTMIRMVHELFFTLFALLVLGVKIMIIVIGVRQASMGLATVGTIVALVFFVDKVYSPIAIFNVLYVDYKLDRVALNRFVEFLGLPDDRNLTEGADAKLTRGDILLQNVSFSYGDTPVLSGIDAEIPGGSVTVLAGISGTGKSTLARIMMGLVKPSTGRVLVDGQDLSRVNLMSYYRHVAYISQEAPVFDGTLRENIAFDMQAEDGRLRELLDKVQLTGFLRGLPKGLDTQVGERGVKLSGGERQRLALARVMLQRPALVILDEPTSAMDGLTERQVVSAFHRELAGSTMIVIAHRYATVRDADRIIVLDGGKIAEQGTREELLSQSGIYARLEHACT